MEFQKAFGTDWLCEFMAAAAFIRVVYFLKWNNLNIVLVFLWLLSALGSDLSEERQIYIDMYRYFSCINTRGNR